MMPCLLTLAGKEIRDGLRNCWVLSTTLLLGALSLTLAFLGSAPTGTVGVAPLEVTIVSLSSLTTFLVPLIALLLSFDAIVGEMESGTMLLLLSYPVARWQIVLGKFIGHVAILGFATLLGYGVAGVALAATGAGIDRAACLALAELIGSSILLGAVFLSIGTLTSTLVRDRGAAAGLAIGIWLVFVLLYDMAVLGILVADGGRTMTEGVVEALLLANPTDIFRFLNLVGSEHAAQFAGMAGLARHAHFGPLGLAALLCVWAAVPLASAALVFSRRQI